MLFQGKILYAMDVLSPETHDTIKLGYSPAQLTWANEHEEQIWAFFIEQDLLYNINPKVYLKYIHDGNSTNGFPKESPTTWLIHRMAYYSLVYAGASKHQFITIIYGKRCAIDPFEICV